MDRPTGSPRFYLASSVTEKTLVANSEERLLSILATLEECQGALVASGNRETAQLVSVAILELRIKLNRINSNRINTRRSSHPSGRARYRNFSLAGRLDSDGVWLLPYRHALVLRL